MRILVISGIRFIGLATVRALPDAAHDITLFHRGQTGPELPPSIRPIAGGTVRNHLSKLGVCDRAQAALKAREPRSLERSTGC